MPVMRRMMMGSHCRDNALFLLGTLLMTMVLCSGIALGGEDSTISAASRLLRSSSSLVQNSAASMAEGKSSSTNSKCWLWNDGKECLKDTVPADEIAEGPEREKVVEQPNFDSKGNFIPRISNRPVSARLFIREFIRRTLTRQLLNIDTTLPDAIVIPLLGSVHIEDTQFIPNGTVTVRASIGGKRTTMTMEISKDFEFKMSFSVPKGLPSMNIASALGSTLAAGNNAFITSMLKLLSLEGSKISIEIGCTTEELLRDGMEGFCEPTMYIQGRGDLVKKMGLFPAFGEVVYSGSLSRGRGFFVSISIPTLRNFTLSLLSGTSKIMIDAEIVEVSMQSFVMEHFLNTTVGHWPLEESEIPSPSVLSALSLAESTALTMQSVEDISKYMRMRLVGSFDIQILDFYAAAHIDLAFNADSGNISFTASNIRHPPFIMHGASLIMRHIHFDQTEESYALRGEVTIFSVPLRFSGSYQKVNSSFDFDLLVALNENQAAFDLAQLASANIPEVLKSFRLSQFLGEIIINKDEVFVFTEATGEVMDSVDFHLEFGFHRKTGKKPDIALRFTPKLRNALPVYEVIPQFKSIPILSGLRFKSLSINPLNITSDGKFNFHIESNISLWDTTMSFGGGYDDRQKSFSFFTRSLPDAKQLPILSVVPSLVHIPIVKELALDAFAVSISRTSSDASVKFDIDGTGSIDALQVRIHVVFGGDVKKPRILFDSKMKEGHSLPLFERFDFLSGTPLPDIRLTSLSGSMQDDVYSFSIGGYVTKDLHLYGKIVTNVVTKSGSFDFKLSSSSEGGLKISSILKTLKGIPIIDDIGFRSIDLTLHREKGKTDSGDINAEALLWGVPVTFLCSFSGEKIHISIGTSPTFKGGFALAEQWTILKSIPGLSSFKLNKFSLKIERMDESVKPQIHFHGDADMFNTNAVVSLEIVSKQVQFSVEAKAIDELGLSLASSIPWLQKLPIVKDIKFLSARVIAEIPEDPSGRTLAISASGSFKALQVSISCTLTEKSRSLDISLEPTADRREVALTDLIPLQGIVADIVGDLKLVNFNIRAAVLGDMSSANSKKNSELAIFATSKVFGYAFDGLFEYKNDDIAFELSLSKESSATFQIGSIPLFKPIADFFGNFAVNKLELSLRHKEFRFAGTTRLFDLDHHLSITIKETKEVELRAVASAQDGIISLASLVPSLKDNEIFKSCRLSEVEFTLSIAQPKVVFKVQGTSLLFGVPVSASLTIGTGGYLEIAAFTSRDSPITLTQIVPQASHVPVLKTLALREMAIRFTKQPNQVGELSLEGELEILGIAARVEITFSTKGVLVVGTVDFSRIASANPFLAIVGAMSPKFGIMISSYTHSDPRIGNQQLRAGNVAIFGEVTPKGPIAAVATLVDRLTNTPGSIKGLGFAGIISPNVAECSISINLPGLSMKLGKVIVSGGIVLFFSGNGPSFALKFQLGFEMDGHKLVFVSSIKIDPILLSLAGSMVGRWNAPFGIKNTYFENLAVQTGIQYHACFSTGACVPAEFGFTGTFYVKPIHVSIAIAVAIDGSVLVSGSLNVLSAQALIEVGRTLGIPFPSSFGSNIPTFELHSVRIYLASKTIIIGEFTFLPGLSFSAGVRILNFAAYVSVAASMEGIEIFGAMSRVKLGPLEIDRPDNVVIPESVSKLGPAVQSLPKEIGSVDEIKKVASVMSLVEQESDDICPSYGGFQTSCRHSRQALVEAGLGAEYNGPILAAAFTAKSQVLFISGRIRLFDSHIAVHIHISLQAIEFKFSFSLMKVIHVDCEAGADISSFSNIRVKAEIRVKDLRNEILQLLEKVFGIEQQKKKETLDKQAEHDAQIARQDAEKRAKAAYEECVRKLPAHQQNDDRYTGHCVSNVNVMSIFSEVIGSRVADLHHPHLHLTAELVEYRRHLTSVLMEHSSMMRYQSLAVTSFVESRWGVIKKAVQAAQQAVQTVAKAVTHVVTHVVNTVIKITQAAASIISQAVQKAAQAIFAAAEAAWNALKRGLFLIVRSLLDAFYFQRAFFELAIADMNSKGTFQAALDVRIGGRQFNWNVALKFGSPLDGLKSLGDMIWNSIKKIASWF